MNNIERAKKLRALKEEMEQKLKALKEAKQQKKLVEQKNSLSHLFEGELERAQIILAAKDVLERLQKMAEGLAKMTAEDIMPISDNMKGVFGTEVAETFESVANEQLASALEAVRSAKEQLNTQVLRMEGKISPEEAAAPSNDMMNDGGEEGSEGGDDLGGDDLGAEGGDDLGGDDLGAGGEEGGDDAEAELDDLFGGDEAAATGGEPLGRAKKESVNASGKVLAEGEVVQEWANSNIMAAISHIHNDKIAGKARELALWIEENLPLRTEDGSHIPCFDTESAFAGLIMRTLSGEDTDMTIEILERNIENFAKDQATAKKFMREVHKLTAHLEGLQSESFDDQKKTLA